MGPRRNPTRTVNEGKKRRTSISTRIHSAHLQAHTHSTTWKKHFIQETKSIPRKCAHSVPKAKTVDTTGLFASLFDTMFPFTLVLFTPNSSLQALTATSNHRLARPNVYLILTPPWQPHPPPQPPLPLLLPPLPPLHQCRSPPPPAGAEEGAWTPCPKRPPTGAGAFAAMQRRRPPTPPLARLPPARSRTPVF